VLAAAVFAAGEVLLHHQDVLSSEFPVEVFLEFSPSLVATAIGHRVLLGVDAEDA
jgi:hypothetical protein